MTRNERSSKRKLMRDVQIASFSLTEAVLYLDTHPYDLEAMRALTSYCAKKSAAVAAYEAEYGPLRPCAFNNSEYRSNGTRSNSYGENVAPAGFSWATDPWPWEIDNC